MAARVRNGHGSPEALDEDVPERRGTEEEANRQTAVVSGIARIFREALTCTTEEQLYHACLSAAEEVTQSEFGFLAEINGQTGLLDSIVISDPGWDACRMQNVARHGQRALPVSLPIHGLYGRVIRDGRGFFTNDPASHPDSIGIPAGHPPLRSFVGVPLVHAGATIGMVALGNRKGGYGVAELQSAEALAPAIVQAIMRKRTEQALVEAFQKSQELEGIINRSSSIVLRRRVDFQVVFVSENVSQLGYTAEDLLSGRVSWVGTTHPDDVPRLMQELREHVAEGCDEFPMEYRLFDRDGQLHWMIDRTHALRGEDGKIAFYESVITDVTLRKRAEEALRRSESRFRTIFHDAPVGMLVLSAEGRFLQVNPAFCQFLGFTEQELLAKSIQDVTHPEDREASAKTINAVLAAGAPVLPFENRYLHASGRVLWGEVGVSLFQNASGNYGHIVEVVDITGRKQAEHAVRLSEAKYRRLYESMRDAFVSVDMDGWIQEYNEAYREMLGYGPGELSAFTYMDLTPSKWHAFQAEIIERQVLPRGYSDIYEKEYRRKDGTVVPVELRTVLLRDERGEPCGMWATLRDITERKRIEGKIRSLNATLGRRVTERTEEIQMLHDVASMANQARNAAEAIEYCLQRVAKYSGWILAHALLPAAEDAEELVSACFWTTESAERSIDVCIVNRPGGPTEGRASGGHPRFIDNAGRYEPFRKMLSGMRFRTDEGLPGRVFAGGEPVWTTDLHRDLVKCLAVAAEEVGICTAAAFPALVGERVVAVLEFFSDRLIPPDPRITNAMAGVGMQLGRVLERIEFEEHLLTIAEEVRQGIAQDLHDDIGQELTGLELKAATLAEMLAAAEGPAGRLAADIATALERTHGKVRGLSQGLLPAELERGMLVAALDRLAATTTTDSRIICKFECSDPEQVFDDRVAVHLYRIAQEAVSNAVRHSRATSIEIFLDRENGSTALRIRDDGMGMLAKAMRPGGMGLRTMRYRAGLINAKLKVGPCPGGGTQVLCRLAARGDKTGA